MRRESRVAHSAMARLADAREGTEGKRRDLNVAYSALARLPDAREGLNESAANRVLPAPRFRISRTRARG